MARRPRGLLPDGPDAGVRVGRCANEPARARPSLGVLALVGAALAPLVAHGLFAGVADPAIRHDQIRLGTVFLWFFLPQVVMYAAGMVATSVLNARNHFAIPAFAPALNNVIVTAT